MPEASLAWPPASDEPALVRIETEVEIARPIDAVFAFATHAALWHRWHPATASVSDVADRPLVVGDRVTESIRAGGRRFVATWTVVACQAPTLWVISTRTREGLSRIVYELRPEGTACRFKRTLAYRSLLWPWRTLDASITRWILERQSAQALTNLKGVLETERTA